MFINRHLQTLDPSPPQIPALGTRRDVQIGWLQGLVLPSGSTSLDFPLPSCGHLPSNSFSNRGAHIRLFVSTNTQRLRITWKLFIYCESSLQLQRYNPFICQVRKTSAVHPGHHSGLPCSASPTRWPPRIVRRVKEEVIAGAAFVKWG